MGLQQEGVMLREQLGQVLPHVNAGLNTLCALLLVAGRVAILRGQRDLHKRLMLSAFTVSALFLVCYLTRFALTGTHPYPGTGPMKTVYLTILFSHMALAAVTPILAIRAIQHGLANRLPEHTRIVRYAFPIWLYVSITGVIVYVMLYHH
jgi:putative membrane protein